MNEQVRPAKILEREAASPNILPAGDLRRQDSLLVEARDIHHSFGGNKVLSGVSLTIQPGELLSLLGPSGSGKTTLLRAIAGLIQADSGSIMFAGRDVSPLTADQRDAGYVFQNYALFPHLSVLDNIAFPLRIRRTPATELRRRTMEMIERMRLDGLADRRPAELSGGQQQRVALARALVFHPKVLLMDEPLGSLDKKLRQSLQIELRHLQRTIGITTIYVTHDQEEAFSLSDKIAVMGSGHIRQLATPEEIYHRPADLFVAEFVGDLNHWAGVVVAHLENRTIVRTEGDILVQVEGAELPPVHRQVEIGIRPEKLELKALASGGTADCRARVNTVVFKGTHHWVELAFASGQKLSAIVHDARDLREGHEVGVQWNPRDWRLFTR